MAIAKNMTSEPICGEEMDAENNREEAEKTSDRGSGAANEYEGVLRTGLECYLRHGCKMVVVMAMAQHRAWLGNWHIWIVH